MSAFAIVDAEADATALLAALHARCFSEIWDRAAIAMVMATPGAFGFIALAGQQPIGFALARAAADEAEILSIGVLPEYRRQGAGEALLQAVLASLAGSRVERCFLEVATDNASAVALYRRFGFETVGRRHGYYKSSVGTVDAAIMRKQVTQTGDE